MSITPKPPQIIPYLFYSDVGAALDFLSRAFGFKEEMRVGTPSGGMHGEASFQGQLVMMGQGAHERSMQTPRTSALRRWACSFISMTSTSITNRQGCGRRNRPSAERRRIRPNLLGRRSRRTSVVFHDAAEGVEPPPHAVGPRRRRVADAPAECRLLGGRAQPKAPSHNSRQSGALRETSGNTAPYVGPASGMVPRLQRADLARLLRPRRYAIRRAWPSALARHDLPMAVRGDSGLVARGGPPRGIPGRAPWRTLGDVAAHSVGHLHRGRQHRRHHAAWREQSEPGARHFVRRRDDHPQRHGRPVAAPRRLAPSRAAIQSSGRERLSRGHHHARGADADPAGFHPDDARPLPVSRTGDASCADWGRPLRHVSGDADRPASRLLQPRQRARGRRGLRRRRAPRRAALAPAPCGSAMRPCWSPISCPWSFSPSSSRIPSIT